MNFKQPNRFYKTLGQILKFFRVYKYSVEIISFNPTIEQLKPDILYVVGEETYVKWIYLKCPDNCDEVIMLSLSSNKRPHWSIKWDKLGRPTIHPSIHKLDGCKSHFWIKRGKLIWAKY